MEIKKSKTCRREKKGKGDREMEEEIKKGTKRENWREANGERR